MVAAAKLLSADQLATFRTLIRLLRTPPNSIDLAALPVGDTPSLSISVGCATMGSS
jgi:hypothetical protein